jgi:soluble lytic murein transglycosylase
MSETRRRPWLGQLPAIVGMAACLSSLGCSGCSAPQAVPKDSQNEMGIATPLDVDAASTDGASPQGSGSGDLRLEAFMPVLLEPRFEAAHEAHSREQHELALQRYAQTLGEEPKDPIYILQLGLLQLDAGARPAAIVSFAAAAQAPWILSGYASYLAGRTALSEGKAQLAMSHLVKVGEDLPVPAGLHRGEAALLLGRRDMAATELRKFLDSREAPEGWVRASILLAELLSETGIEGPKPTLQEQLEALRHVRRVAIRTAGGESAKRATELEAKILGSLPPAQFEEQRRLSTADQLVRLQALTDAKQFEDARIAAQELLSSLPPAERFSSDACEARLLRNKALAAAQKWGQAVDDFGDVLRHCKDPDLRARALFLAGRYAVSDKRYSHATRLFAQLEKEAPDHRLADDARLRGAEAYLELSDRARHTKMLMTIAEDYPKGDVALDGTFALALTRIEKRDWAGAASVLERGMQAAEYADQSRDHEWACRERYFRARAWMETGEKERGLAEFEKIAGLCPLSYYMQQAYTRLYAAGRERAEATLKRVQEQTASQPFSFAHSPEFETPAFKRALGLLRVGQVDWATREIDSLGALDSSSPELLWALALVYERGGSAHLSQQLTRGRLTDWLRRWPVGDWRKAWELAFPRPFHRIVASEAEKNGLSEALVYGVMREESMFDARAQSHADAYGLMQLIEPTAKHFSDKLGMGYSRSALLIPRVNIALGTKVLQSYSDRFPDNPLLGIPSYNAGPGRPKRWLKERPDVDFDVWVELIPFRETRRYTKRVLASRGVYTALYGPDGADWRLPLRLVTD